MRKLLFVSIVGLLLAAMPAHAQVSDGMNDFLGTYAGPQATDVDVLSASVVLTNNTFLLSATMAGDIGQTAGAFYVFGFDRGAGVARFATGPTAIPNTADIKFDSVVILRPDGSAAVTRIGGTTTNFAPGSVTIAGATLTFGFAATELPTAGFAVPDYTWNLWPRVGTGNNNQISDFAPNNTNSALIVAPEPASLALGLIVLPFVRRPRWKK